MLLLVKVPKNSLPLSKTWQFYKEDKGSMRIHLIHMKLSYYHCGQLKIQPCVISGPIFFNHW